jgi:hypothetical protein
MKVKIAMFEAASVYVRVTLTAARSSLIKCLHCDDVGANQRQAGSGAISRSPPDHLATRTALPLKLNNEIEEPLHTRKVDGI